MTIQDIQQLIANGESQTLELKKSTGELKDAMHTACAFLNSEGGWLIFGVTPDSLRIVGQQVTDSTRREIAQALASLEPAVDVSVEYINVTSAKADRSAQGDACLSKNQLVAIHFEGRKDNHVPYTCNGRPYYKVESTTRQMLREEHLEIPVEALREALTNALCHRRYEDPRTTVTLAIFDDRLEITNPGHFPKPLTPENIKDPHGSYPHNLRIAQVLYFSKYLEGWGTGIRRMMDICREEGVPEPVYESDGYTVKITFWKTNQKTNQMDEDTMQKDAETIQKTMQKESETIQKTIQKDTETIQKTIQKTLAARNIEVTELQLDILVYFTQHPQATRKEYINSGENISEGGTISNIARLQELGLLRREGGRKSGHWVVMLDNDNETSSALDNEAMQ